MLTVPITHSFNLWWHKPGEANLHSPSMLVWIQGPGGCSDHHAHHHQSFGNQGGGLPEIPMLSFPESSITNYMKWPKSKFFVILYKPKYYYCWFKSHDFHTKKVLNNHKIPNIYFYQVSGYLIKVEVYLFFLILLLKYSRILILQTTPLCSDMFGLENMAKMYELRFLHRI